MTIRKANDISNIIIGLFLGAVSVIKFMHNEIGLSIVSGVLCVSMVMLGIQCLLMDTKRQPHD